MDETIFGVPIATSDIVPPGQLWLIAERDIARSFMLPESLFREPSYTEKVFRDCRRAIAKTCPLTAPPEWADLPSLWPEMNAFAMRALYNEHVTSYRRFLSVVTA